MYCGNSLCRNTIRSLEDRLTKSHLRESSLEAQLRHCEEGMEELKEELAAMQGRLSCYEGRFASSAGAERNHSAERGNRSNSAR
jgi:hypothetical protein